jgi:SAM-dependent methyltransferase
MRQASSSNAAEHAGAASDVSPGRDIPAALRAVLACGRCRRTDLREDGGRLRCAVCAASLERVRGVVTVERTPAAPAGWRHAGLDYDRAARRGKRSRKAAAVDEVVLPALRGAVLEVGCGTGRFLIAAAGRAWPLVGADASLDMISRAAERGLPHLVHAPAERLPFRDRSFDTVVSVLAWQLVEDEAYAEVARVLRPGGRFIFSLEGGAPWLAEIALHRARRAWKRRLGPLAPEDREQRLYYAAAFERARLARAGLAFESAVGVGGARGGRALAARFIPSVATDVVITAARR